VGIARTEDNVSVADDTYAAHTLRCNTQSIGVAVCCMANAIERPFRAGTAPMTSGQWDLLAQVAAELARRYNIPVTRSTILGHGEVQELLNIPQKQKWDPMVLPWDSSIPKRDVGDLFRAKVSAFLDG
jgi:N-acetyl-anhydromuramyl-L-alanine amidase AmpD